MLQIFQSKNLSKYIDFLKNENFNDFKKEIVFNELTNSKIKSYHDDLDDCEVMHKGLTEKLGHEIGDLDFDNFTLKNMSDMIKLLEQAVSTYRNIFTETSDTLDTLENEFIFKENLSLDLLDLQDTITNSTDIDDTSDTINITNESFFNFIDETMKKLEFDLDMLNSIIASYNRYQYSSLCYFNDASLFLKNAKRIYKNMTNFND